MPSPDLPFFQHLPVRFPLLSAPAGVPQVLLPKPAKIVTSKAAHERAEIQRNMDSEEFKNYARLRNGVETVPSNIRKNYHLKKIPREKQRGKFFF